MLCCGKSYGWSMLTCVKVSSTCNMSVFIMESWNADISIFTLNVVGAVKQASSFYNKWDASSKPPGRSPKPRAAFCQSKYANETTIIRCF